MVFIFKFYWLLMDYKPPHKSVNQNKNPNYFDSRVCSLAGAQL